MILTEEQARTKWCPAARFGEVFGPDQGTAAALAYNRSGVNKEMVIPRTCRCIASECMMWQWANDENGEPLYNKKSLGGGHFDNAPMGYCGLTSK